MRILEHTIDLPSWETEFRIIPFGCVHGDTDGFSESLWLECVEDIAQPHTIGIPCGDYLDAERTHVRKMIARYRAEDEGEIESTDRLHEVAYTQFYRKYLHKIRDRLPFIAKGNHLWQFSDGTTSDNLLAKLCGCPYGDKPTFLRLRIRIHGRIAKTFKVLVHHEGGGGGYSKHGTDVNAAETKMYQFSAFDIVIFSHTHRKWGLLIPDLDLTERGEPRLIERTRALIRTGCFTRSYAPNCLSHYAHKKLLPPTELGYVTLKIKMSRNNDESTMYRMKLES